MELPKDFFSTVFYKNKAKNIKGLQIGLVNVTNGTDGTSVGLINISKGKRAKHRVGFLLRVPRKN